MKKIWKIFFVLLFILSIPLYFGAISATTVNGNFAPVKLPILMYHKISERKASWGSYSISPEELESDVKLILSRGFTPITMSDLENYVSGKGSLPEKPIMLTFDDGNASDYTYAFPLALKYKIKIVCSPVGYYTEKFSGEESPIYLSAEKMQKMQESGLVEFQNHSYNLHNFDSTRKGCLKSAFETEAKYSELIAEDLRLSQELFVENKIKKPTCFTYPYGMRDELLLSCVKKAGFTSSLGTYARMNIITDDLYDLCRFNRPHNYNISKILDLAE